MGFTIISNFYVGVDLLRSKALYIEAFYFPLTKSEHSMLNKYKFVNITNIVGKCDSNYSANNVCVEQWW